MRKIILPPPYNKRIPKMWEIIAANVDFDGKTVLDLGCGYGDFAMRCCVAGARAVTAIDYDPGVFVEVADIVNAARAPVNLLLGKIEDLGNWSPFDIVSCFSVLPYVDDPQATLRWMADHGRVCLIEMQYAGDGPGLDEVKSDADMQALLEQAGFVTITALGFTEIEERHARRTIWKCER